jgi:hypothetical protein
MPRCVIIAMQNQLTRKLRAMNKNSDFGEGVEQVKAANHTCGKHAAFC